MTISVIIPAHNEEKYLGDCLKSVIENAPANLKEIIVVDNASGDNTAKVAAGFSGVRVVSEPQKGITKARQRGLMEASGDLVACIDADDRVNKRWFEILNREFSKDPKLVCLSGPCVFYDAVSPVKARLAAVWNFLAKVLSVVVGYLAQGGNFVIKRQELLSAGGFDTSIEFYGEDTDIARRMHQFGKVRFLLKFKISASARRLEKEGFAKTGFQYLVNFLSVVLMKSPVTHKYKDIR